MAWSDAARQASARARAARAKGTQQHAALAQEAVRQYKEMGGVQRASAAERAEPRRTPAATQRELDKIRKADPYLSDKRGPLPTGKNVLLYHRTSEENAKAITQQGFSSKTAPERAAQMSPEEIKDRADNAFFVRKQVADKWAGYGPATVSVTVPRKQVETDKTMGQFYPAPVKVSLKNLKGRKARRAK